MAKGCSIPGLEAKKVESAKMSDLAKAWIIVLIGALGLSPTE